jgi:hypothetical protein
VGVRVVHGQGSSGRGSNDFDALPGTVANFSQGIKFFRYAVPA